MNSVLLSNEPKVTRDRHGIKSFQQSKHHSARITEFLQNKEECSFESVSNKCIRNTLNALICWTVAYPKKHSSLSLRVLDVKKGHLTYKRYINRKQFHRDDQCEIDLACQTHIRLRVCSKFRNGNSISRRRNIIQSFGIVTLPRQKTMFKVLCMRKNLPEHKCFWCLRRQTNQ